MQIYKNKVFYVIGMFLDTRFIETVVIQMTGILYKIIYFGLGFIMILPLLMNLHEIQCLLMWQIECFASIYSAVQDARIVDNLGKFILNCTLASMQPCTLVHLVQFVH